MKEITIQKIETGRPEIYWRKMYEYTTELTTAVDKILEQWSSFDGLAQQQCLKATCLLKSSGSIVPQDARAKG